VVAAVHQGVDALTRVAMTDIQAVEAADRAGRLYVPTRSVSAEYDVPRPFVPAPFARFLALKEAYQAALNASMEAAGVLDELAIVTRGPSMALALARAAASARPPRRKRFENDSLDEPMSTGMPFANSRASTGQAGLLEQALRDRGIFDPIILLRAAAIDNGARRLITQVESAILESGSSRTHENSQGTVRSAAELAVQSFPRSQIPGLSAPVHRIQPRGPSVQATLSHNESRNRGAGHHS
jgi:hypothetical protein